MPDPALDNLFVTFLGALDILDDQDSEPQGSATSLTSTSHENLKPEDSTERLKPEKSKAALRSGLEFSSYSIHVASLCFTATVLQLSLRDVYWSDEEGFENHPLSLGLSQPVMTGILQFVAKLHEILVLASLSTIIIDVLQRRLLVSRGVPFGFLVGGYRFGSGNVLFSGSFWGPLADAIRFRKIELFGLGLLIGLGAVYANAIGPASALLIVPTLNWWPAYDMDVLMVGDGPIFPMTLNATKWMSSCFKDPRNVPFGCPGFGASDIQNVDYFTQPEDSTNHTFTQRYGSAKRNLYTSPAIEFPESNSVQHISSTVHSVVLEAMGLSEHFVSTFADRNTSIYKVGRPQLETLDTPNMLSPIVWVECSFTSASSWDTESPLFVPTNLMKATSDPDPKVDVRLIWNTTNPDRADSNVIWLDRNEFKFEAQRSRASVGVSAELYFAKIDGDSTGTPSKLMCVVDARWAATKISYNPSSSDLVSTNITDMSLFTGATIEKDLRIKYGIGDPIHITTEWAELLDTPVVTEVWDAQGRPVFYNYILELSDKYTDVSTARKNAPSDFAKFLSLLLVDGLSRVASKDESGYAVVWDPARRGYVITSLSESGYFTSMKQYYLELGTVATLRVQRYGWGYGIRTKTAIFAISVLFIHAVLAVVEQQVLEEHGAVVRLGDGLEPTAEFERGVCRSGHLGHMEIGSGYQRGPGTARQH
ncbi:hypothetical protein BJ166DRAFT_580993 [Pestalotiopsis sp. NC0098]|nr:hypothetical protein BJ166DRAFT_580993 [Pestalotiopsis sp. NC0098]